MLRRLWALVAIVWLIGGTIWVVSSDWGYVEYHRQEERRQESIAAYEASSGQTFKEWQEKCFSAPQKPTTGFFGPPTRDCDSPGAMPPRKGWDYYEHEISVIAPLVYSHFRKSLLWNVLAPILISGPLILWLIPGLVRWVRYGSNAPANARPRNTDVSSTVTRGRS
jgi:hypothetical protein